MEGVENKVAEVEKVVEKVKKVVEMVETKAEANQLKLQNIDRDTALFKSASDTQVKKNTQIWAR